MAIALAATPAFVASSATTTTTTAAFTPATGEILVLGMLTEDSTKGYSGTINTTGSTFSAWTLAAQDTTASNTFARIYTGAVTSGGVSSTVAATMGATGGFHSMCLWRFTGAQLAGTPAVVQTHGTGAPIATLTTAAAGSIIPWINGDWAAVSPTGRTYNTTSATPTDDGVDNQGPSFYVGYFAHQSAASAGSQTIGITAPTGQTFKILGIEVQSSGAAPVGLPELVMAPMRRS